MLKPTDKPRWNTSEPQFYRDSWRRTVRRLDYQGHCVVCSRRTYSFEDGGNDPRGILGDRAADPLVASEYDAQGPTIPLCFLCGNEEPRYRRGMEEAWQLWTLLPEKGKE